MLMKTLSVAAVALCGLITAPSQALADQPDITVEWAFVDNSAGWADPDFPEDVVTIDIIVHVSGDCTEENDWTSATFQTLLNGATLYHHPYDTDMMLPPAPELFAEHPGLEFTSYVCSADTDLSDSAAPPLWHWIVKDSAHDFVLGWIDGINTGNGTYAIARISLLPCRDTADWWPEVILNDSCGGQYDEFMFLHPRPCPGDLNGDGAVDLADLGVLLASYGIDNGGDEDCDGDTDLSDLSDLLANYGCEP